MTPLPNLELTRTNPDELHHDERVPLLQPRQVALPRLRSGMQLARTITSTRVARGA